MQNINYNLYYIDLNIYIPIHIGQPLIISLFFHLIPDYSHTHKSDIMARL